MDEDARGGFVAAVGTCFGCGTHFSFNPHRVPSIRWPQPDGERRPVCSRCMSEANGRRMREGKEPHRVPAGAYDPLPADEL